ncbi:MAG: hypothetical protein ACKVRO_03220 [Micropepsaceae bacterium]
MKIVLVLASALIVMAAGEAPWGYKGPGWYQVEQGQFIYGGPYPIKTTCERGSGAITCLYFDAWPTPPEPPAFNEAAATGTDVTFGAEWKGPGGYQMGEDEMMGSFIVSGPYKSESGCNSTRAPTTDDYTYSCVEIKKVHLEDTASR